MNAEHARAILKQAKEDKNFEESIPSEDDVAIVKAEEIVDEAQEAWDDHVRGPEVEAILRLAADEGLMGSNGSNGSGNSQEEETPPPTGEGDPETELQKLQTEEPWEEYDKDKVGEIIESIDIALESNEAEDEKEALFTHIEIYERANKSRVRVLKRLEEIGEARAEAQGEQEEPQGEAEGEGDGPDAEASEADVPGASGPDSGEGDSQEAEAASGGTEPDAPDESVREADAPRSQGTTSTQAATEDPGAYRDLMEEVADEAQAQFLHIPPVPPQDEDYDLPFDLTTLSDQELQSFYGIYTAFAYRKGFELAIEEAKARTCKDAADELFRTFIVKTEKYDENKKQKTMTVLEAEVESLPALVTWRKRQHKHESFVSHHRNERDALYKVVETLSRMETMRDQDYQRSGGGGRRSSPKR